MQGLLRSLVFVCALTVLCQSAFADGISTYVVNLDTSSLAGSPDAPFYVYLELVDGSGIGDGNNTVTLNNFDLSGGGALGSPAVFGGTSGSLETGVSITDTSFVSVFAEQFEPGNDLSFTLGLTSNDDSGGTPDGFTLFLFDSSGVPLPTLAPTDDYFLTAVLGSGGLVFNEYGSDPSRSLSVGGPVSIPEPTVSLVAEAPVPEPSPIYLLGSALAMMGVLRYRQFRSMIR